MMHLTRRGFLGEALAAAGTSVIGSAANAATYPTRTITIVGPLLPAAFDGVGT